MEGTLNGLKLMAILAVASGACALFAKLFKNKDSPLQLLALAVVVLGILAAIYWISDGQVDWFAQGDPESRWRAP